MNKNLKRFLILILICIILIIIYEMIHTYAIFQSDISGNTKFQEGVWNIFVNGTEVTNGVEKSFTIDKINLEDSRNVKEGKLAPGTTGNFEIAINPKDTDVSIRYDIMIDSKKLTNKNIKIKSISLKDSSNSLINTDENTFTGIITLEQIKANAISNIKVNIQWINQETNNYEDTKLGSTYDAKLSIPIKIRFSQYLGEEIK